MPVVGFLSGQSPDTYAPFPAAFRQGLGDQLPALAGDLVRRQANVIAATGGIASGFAAKAATTSIPIVFNSGEDPVQAGLVSSLNQPGGNVTGVSWFSVDSEAKRLSLLHQLVPSAAVVGLLANPKDPELDPALEVASDAARAIIPSAFAAPIETSRTRPRPNGPRSLTTTITL
jgi:putative tryptophan/tyrosine transport system substrate-binding protein